MKQLCSALIIENSSHTEKTLSSLKKNENYITQIIPSHEYNTTPTNLAHKLNIMISHATQEYILILNTDIELEEETLEEFFETLEETPDADIIYPSEIFIQNGNEEIKNYEDWYQKEKLLLPSLAIEDHLPQWGILIKKETIKNLGGFDPKYGEHTIYAFIYNNLDKLRLKHSELSFINHYISDTFIDTSYRSLLLRTIVNTYSMQEVFSSLDWKQNEIALATANTLIGDKLAKYFDFYNAIHYYRKALLIFHNQTTLKKLLDAYIQMGLFQEAKFHLQTQNPTKEIVEEYQEKIEKIDKLTQELEKAVESGKSREILTASLDIISYYKGAPIHNILGIIFFMHNEFEKAYKFFYKAATINPLDQDILYNLTEVAKKLEKEQEVIDLYNRIITKG